MAPGIKGFLKSSKRLYRVAYRLNSQLPVLPSSSKPSEAHFLPIGDTRLDTALACHKAIACKTRTPRRLERRHPSRMLAKRKTHPWETSPSVEMPDSPIPKRRFMLRSTRTSIPEPTRYPLAKVLEAPFETLAMNPHHSYILPHARNSSRPRSTAMLHPIDHPYPQQL